MGCTELAVVVEEVDRPGLVPEEAVGAGRAVEEVAARSSAEEVVVVEPVAGKPEEPSAEAAVERRRASGRNRRAAAVGEPGEEEEAAEHRTAVDAGEVAEVQDEPECTDSVVEICTGQEDYTAV